LPLWLLKRLPRPQLINLGLTYLTCRFPLPYFSRWETASGLLKPIDERASNMSSLQQRLPSFLPLLSSILMLSAKASHIGLSAKRSSI
jgi:hypothetical protein